MPYSNALTYMRISVTDRCNERCVYCLPFSMSDWLPRSEILTFEEIYTVARVAIDLGIHTFRITGGEPLVRQDLPLLIAGLKALPGCEKVTMTSNATRLKQFAGQLKDAGLDGVNISLDSLDPANYQAITRMDKFHEAMEGLEAAEAAGFEQIKINTVLMRNHNEHELIALAEFAHRRGHPIRFIELMPVSTREVLNEENFLAVGHARRILEQRFDLEPAEVALGKGPARYFQTEHGGLIGFIGAMTNLHFCESCNKLRVTADGKLRPCLGSHLEFDLKPALRETGTPEAVHEVFSRTIEQKPDAHEFRESYQPSRRMIAIGG